MGEKRVKKALLWEWSMDMFIKADEETVFRMTDGYGADGVVITAATASDEVVSNAFQICRKKGRWSLWRRKLNLKEGYTPRN